MRSGSIPNYRLYPEFQHLEDNLLAYIPGAGYNVTPWQTDKLYTNVWGYPNLAVPTTFSNVIANQSQFVYRKSIQSAIAMTNLFENPSVETNINYIVINGAGTTLTRSYENSVAGSYCAKGVHDGANANQGFQLRGSAAPGYIPGIVAGNAYTVSFYAKTSTNENLNFGLFYYDAAFAVTGSSTIAITTSGTWTRYSITLLAPAASIYARVFVGRAIAAGYVWTLWTDAIQVEQSTYLTPYIDGSLGLGHAWTGAAHASTSTRAATDIRYDSTQSGFMVNQANNGSVCCWVYVFGYDSAGGANDIWRLAGSAGTSFVMRIYNIGADGRLDMFWGTTQIATAIGVYVFPLGQWVHLCITNKDGLKKIYADGIERISSLAGTEFVYNPASSLLLTRGGAGTRLNGYIDDFAIFDKALTDAEILEIATCGHPLGQYPSDDYVCTEPFTP